VHYKYTSGETDVGPTNFYYCAGPIKCIESGYAELLGVNDVLLARSK
jgi:hypothetical protein